MGTLTITGSTFANLGTTPPANWPANVTFPAGGSPNGTKSFTISDADWLALLTWAATLTSHIQAITGQTNSPFTPTAAQILLAWVRVWSEGTKAAVQQYNTQPAAAPAPITMA